MASLSDSVHQHPRKPTVNFSKLLLQHIWEINSTIEPFNIHFLPQYYFSCINSTDQAYVAPETHKDVVDIVQFVKDGRNHKLFQLRSDLLSLDPKPHWLRQASEEAAQEAIELGFKLWLMIHPNNWQDSQTLDEFVKSHFCKSRGEKDRPANSKGQPAVDFSARSLYRVGGLEIIFTNDISDHLELSPRSQQLKIFRHCTVLNGTSSAATREAYPDGLLEETALTMGLLFPSTELNSHRWDRRVRQKADVDIELGHKGALCRQLNQYVYWRDRLVKLQEMFDEAKPRKMRQWVHDRRDGNQRATFWLAVLAICLTLLFGFIQSITGILGLVL